MALPRIAVASQPASPAPPIASVSTSTLSTNVHPDSSLAADAYSDEQLYQPARTLSQRRSFKSLFLLLRPGISVINLLTFLIAATFTISFFVFINSSQTFVLKEILRVPDSSLGYTSGSLVFYDELLAVITVTFWGALSDSAGRHSVYAAGYLFIGVSLILYPLATNVYPQLLIYRLVFSLGGAAVSSMLAAVVADIVVESDRGKVSGIAGCATGLGALIGLFGFLRMPTLLGYSGNGLRLSFTIVGCIAFILAGIVFAGLRQPSRSRNQQLRRNEQTQNSSEEEINVSPHAPTGQLEYGAISTSAIGTASADGSIESLSGSPRSSNERRGRSFTALFREHLRTTLTSSKDGFAAARQPRILLGYIGSFLARGDTITITLFIPLFVYKFFLSIGKCTDDLDGTVEMCNDAYVLASILSGVTQTFALIGAPVFGFLADRIYRPFLMMAASIMTMAGYLLLYATHDPRSKLQFVNAFLIGAGEIGMVILSLTFVTASSVPHTIRGGVSGVSSFFGAAGILLISKLGGYLFDVWSLTMPFLLVALLHTASIAVSCWVIVTELRSLQAQERIGLVRAFKRLAQLERLEQK
eukprot:jgi/Hompol1/5340/HPOL_001235-RA